MFVIELVYKADLEEIDAQMRPHMAFLKRHYATGTFLISKRPSTPVTACVENFTTMT